MSFLFKQIQAYFEDLATKHVKIAHGTNGRKSFFRYGIDEEVAAIGNKAASPMVVMGSLAGMVRGETSLRYILEIDFLSHVPEMKINQVDEVEKAQQEAFEIMMDFWSRVNYDFEYGDNCGPFQSLDAPVFEAIGPVNQFEMGWRLSLHFGTDAYEYNPANWNE